MDRLNKALGLALVLSAVAVACAAPTIPQSESDDQNETSDPSTAKKPSTKKPPGNNTPAPSNPSSDPDASAPAPTDPSNPTPAPASCSSTTTYADCLSCCDAPTGGALAKADATFGQCACEAGGQCQSVCGATLCNGQQPSAACETCLTNTCEPAADAQCTSAACQAGVQCLQASSCDSKQ